MYADKYESFPHIDALLFDWDDEAFPSSQNIKFAMSSQNLRKEVRDEVDFLYADKQQNYFGRQSFLQVATIIIEGYDQAFSKYLR